MIKPFARLAAISALALSGECPTCAEALAMFVSTYGAQAGNLASNVQQELNRRYGAHRIVCRSSAMEQVYQRVLQLAPTRTTVLITGESGAGKELVARSLHYNSPRRDNPFLAIDNFLGEAANIKKPTLVHIAGEDKFVSKEAQDKINKGLSGHAAVTVHNYAGQEHAFARDRGEHYDAASAKLANDRTEELFKKSLA